MKFEKYNDDIALIVVDSIKEDKIWCGLNILMEAKKAGINNITFDKKLPWWFVLNLKELGFKVVQVKKDQRYVHRVSWS